MATIENKRFTKFRLQLELLASHTSYNSEDLVFKYYFKGVTLSTTNYGDIKLHEVRYRLCDYFVIEYYVGNVRLVDTYDLKVSGDLDCNNIIKEVVQCISDVIDCVTINFKDRTVANDFMNEYLSNSIDDKEDTILYHYSGSDFLVVYTKDFNNRNAYRINKFFVENLVATNLLNDINVKNFKLISHYTDVVYSDKDTEVAYY
jgi:hypothetical protein|nr:MAG TPA: hypothetical protein [Caudoviricetes sp.]